eukprot:CAMPEP_0172403810 /NCGR_PEP_ID=MMETSP1061-20121228/60607_1 /TAXON_ID=37318 /ORGANISM="Pseudo-nitzschia pungens, Strain cf. pungens" /LENGTH=276 /DNA_ID=CAMNT_0013138343 /DNA_START=93 /DNA_END=923 /DNA_ORIENTATION=-
MVRFALAAAFSCSSQAWRATSFVCTRGNGYRFGRTFSPDRVPTAQGQLYPKLHRKNDATLVLFSSGNNKEREKSFLEKAGNAIKSILPKRWFGSDEEKEKLAQKKEVEKQVSGGLDYVFRDAPFGLQMMGKMLSPLMSTAASTLAETMAEQQRNTEQLLEDARIYIVRDPVVASILGEPIDVRTPFSQSSSTTSINGKTQSRVELAFEITGSKNSGVARLLATDGGIVELRTEVGGRVIDVSLSNQEKWPRYDGSYSSSTDDDGIIEAEIVEKKTK